MAHQILVIEDEDGIRETIVDLLASNQFDSLQADNGEEGIEMAIREQPDLIICDIVMPDISGYQVLEALRNKPKTRLIPLIFLTAKASHQAYREGMELGADDYLVKPFTKEELLQSVRSQLQKQSLLLSELHTCYQEINQLKKVNHQLQQNQSMQEDMLKTLVEDLRSNLSKLNLAIYLLKSETNPTKRDQYLEILESELEWEVQLLSQASNLRHIINSGNINFQQRYKLFDLSESNQNDLNPEISH